MPHVAMETRTAVETGSAPKPHLFIFDSESQEEGSQPMECDDAAVPAGPGPISDTAEVVSLNQAQLKEDMRRIRELMKQTNQVTLTEPDIPPSPCQCVFCSFY